MIRGVLGSRASIGGVLGSGRGGAAAAWYLAGGVSAANCIAAYQPKGAASLAASYDNNAAPGNGLADGTYDAAPGTAPTFATATGWTFAAVSSQYLTTGITPTNNQTWSLLVRFSSSGATGVPVFAAADAAGNNPYFGVQPNNATVNRRYFAGNIVTVTPVLSGAHVMGVAGNQGYLDGSADGGTIGTAAGSFGAIHIGRLGLYNGFYFSGTIQAAAIYNTTLTAPQVAAISAAMAAL